MVTKEIYSLKFGDGDGPNLCRVKKNMLVLHLLKIFFGLGWPTSVLKIYIVLIIVLVLRGHKVVPVILHNFTVFCLVKYIFDLLNFKIYTKLCRFEIFVQTMFEVSWFIILLFSNLSKTISWSFSFNFQA